MEGLDIKRIHLLLLTFLILSLSSCVGAATEFRVNSSELIQDAVNKAQSGDTIIVATGTYDGNIDISRSNLNSLVLMSESGNPADTKIVGIRTDKEVISINNKNSVTVNGFTISGAGTGKAGVSLNGGKNCIIENNIFSDDDIGVNIVNSPNNVVRKNVVTRTSAVNTSQGIIISGSNDYNISDNSISNQYLGIYIGFSDGGNIARNSITQSGNHGIKLEGSESATLESNIVDTVTMFGIYLDESHKNVVRNNKVLNGNYDGNGINLLFSDWNKIVGNTVTISNHALFMNNSKYNTMQDNTVPDSAYGIAMRYSENNIIVNNSAYNDTAGIYLTRNSSNNTISRNKAKSNTQNGIELHLGAHDNTLDNNEVNQNMNYGILLENTTNNMVSNNKVSENKVGGIYLCPISYPNIIYNNYFNNTVNTNVNNARCNWNKDRPEKGKNIVNGPYIGGNFWAKPDGTGFSQTATDANSYGFVDSRYDKEANVIDYYPLVEVLLPKSIFSISPTQGSAPLSVQFTDYSLNEESRVWDFGDRTNSTDPNPAHIYSTIGNYTAKLTVNNKYGADSNSTIITVLVSPPVSPVPNFDANPTSGAVPLTVQFTDFSTNATGWNWDFGDGATSTEQSPTHTYSTEGTYNVNLLVSNANGTSPTPKTGTISVEKESHHSSGGSGGGGAGGSPEPQSNVEIKELSQTFVNSGKSVKFEFPRNATSLVSLSFDSKKTAGKTTTIVEMLKGKSTLVTGLPSGEVYKYINIWVGNSGFATPNNIENSVISFKVDKSWIQDKKIDKSSITLNRYSDKKWSQLPASLSGEDNKYLYFTAKTPGFSPFAITGKSTATGTAIQPATGNKTQPVVNDTQNKPDGSTVANADQTAEKKDNTSTPTKESKSTPGFETVCGITGLLAVFLHKRK